MSVEANVFELGTLVILETKVWNATKKVPASRVIEGVETKWVNASKKLIDQARLKDIKTIRGQARHYIEAVSLPFPIYGMAFVPKASVPKVEARLSEYRAEFEQLADAFSEGYEEYIDEAKGELGELFSETDYPQSIRSRFSMQWKFLEMQVPGKLKKISPEVYEQEMRKFQEMMEDAQQTAVLALREGFMEVISQLTNAITGKLDGRPRTIQQRSLQKIEKFFESFQEKNVFKDKELQKVIEQARDIVADIDTDDLKRSNVLAEFINGQLKDVSQELVALTETQKRKMTI
jgi:hypothetical protein